jgi:hypothetical protein
MKKIPFFLLILSCALIGLISCSKKTETTSSESKPLTTKETETTSSENSNNSTNSTINQTPSPPQNSQATKVTKAPPKGKNWSTITNSKWTITTGQYETWDGVNGTGNLTYYGCDNKNNCLSLTGGTITCREGICRTNWRNGNYVYTLENQITEDNSGSPTLIVRENDKIILQETGFNIVESNQDIPDNSSNSAPKNNKPKTLNNQELKNLESLFPEEKVIPSQTFNLNLTHWDQVTFTSVESLEEGRSKLDYYLIKNNEIIYQFPLQEYVLGWGAYELNAVSFKDVDQDQDQDIIVIASYVTGIGRTAAQPFPVTTVYVNDINGFSMNEKLNDLLAEKQPSTIAEAQKIIDEFY